MIIVEEKLAPIRKQSETTVNRINEKQKEITRQGQSCKQFDRRPIQTHSLRKRHWKTNALLRGNDWN